MKIKPSDEMIWKKYYPEEALNFDYPKLNIYDAVYEENRNRLDSIAIEYEGNNIRYGDFFDKTEETIEKLKSKNVSKDDIVTMSMLMCPEFIYYWYALAKMNAISNPIDPRTSPEGIRHYIEEAESDLIINNNLFTGKIIKAIGSDEKYKVLNSSLSTYSDKMPFVMGTLSGLMALRCESLSKKDSRFENTSELESHGLTHTDSEYIKDQPLTIVHTGGTTGTPKGVVLSHDNYNAMAYQYKESKIGFSPDDRFLLIMPPWISYGSGMLHMSFITGMKVAIISKLESKKMADYVLKYQPQWFAGVPAHYKIVSNSKKIPKKGVSFLKGAAVGGDAMSDELYNKANDCLLDNGAKLGVYPGYALTEVTSAFAVKQLGDYKAGSVGIPLPGTTCGIFKFDEENLVTLDEELDYDQTGEICMRTPNMMLGYFKNEEKTNEVIKLHNDGNYWVHTGDLGHIDKDGFLYVDGRIKEMIIRHDGFKIYPSLIEKLVNSVDGVASTKVVGIDDHINNAGQIPKCYITLKPDCEQSEDVIIKNIKSICKATLPEYYIENMDVESIEKMPLTPIGKVDFRALQAMNEESSKDIKRKSLFKK